MRYSTTKAIDLDAMIARNREIIATLPACDQRHLVWSDGEWIVNPELIAQGIVQAR